MAVSMRGEGGIGSLVREDGRRSGERRGEERKSANNGRRGERRGRGPPAASKSRGEKCG